MATVYNLIEFDAGPLGGTKAVQMVEDGQISKWLTTSGEPLSSVVKPPEPYPYHIISTTETPPPGFEPPQGGGGPGEDLASKTAEEDDDEPHKRRRR